jgi:hypothetical protein
MVGGRCASDADRRSGRLLRSRDEPGWWCQREQHGEWIGCGRRRFLRQGRAWIDFVGRGSRCARWLALRQYRSGSSYGRIGRGKCERWLLVGVSESRGRSDPAGLGRVHRDRRVGHHPDGRRVSGFARRSCGRRRRRKWGRDLVGSSVGDRQRCARSERLGRGRRLLAVRARWSAERYASTGRGDRRQWLGGRRCKRVDAEPFVSGRAGGGSGGAGRIRVNTGCGGTLMVTQAAVVSPDRASGCFTEGTQHGDK